MRVIAGIAKGSSLDAPEGLLARPTTDRIKETLFNIINFDLYDCEFLDLFSGSGAIGIEAISRGAKKATFVDDSDIAIDCITRNLLHTKFLDNSEIVKSNTHDAIFVMSKKQSKFDIIFMDPPYEKGLIEPALTAIVEAGILDENGFIIVEHSHGESIPKISGLLLTREKIYRTTIMTFMSLED